MKKFSTSFNGYQKSAVNDFVKEVTNEYESMLNKLKEKDQEIQKLNAALKQYKEIEGTLNKAVVIAEDSAMQIKKTARIEAQNIIGESKKNASTILNDALIKANQVEQEALILKNRVVAFKKRFKKAIEEQLDFIDNIEEDL